MSNIADDLAIAYRDGLKDGKPKWIPVTDRLPDDEMTVLAYCAEDDFYYISRQHRSFSDYDVTHWIPIPEPPKDGENG